MTDTALLDKWVRERDAEAFRQLASRYSALVYATCVRVLRDPIEAEDAAQECFEALARTDRAVGPYLGAWLHRVATNRCRDRIKTEVRRRARENLHAVAHTAEPDPRLGRDSCARRRSAERNAGEVSRSVGRPIFWRTKVTTPSRESWVFHARR